MKNAKSALKKALEDIKERDSFCEDYPTDSGDWRIEKIKEFFTDFPYKILALLPDCVLDDLEKCALLMEKKRVIEYDLESLRGTDNATKASLRKQFSLLMFELKSPYQRLKDYSETLGEEADNV